MFEDTVVCPMVINANNNSKVMMVEPDVLSGIVLKHRAGCAMMTRVALASQRLVFHGSCAGTMMVEPDVVAGVGPGMNTITAEAV